MGSDAWTDKENDAIVADYFSMLSDDLSGRPYIKAQHNRHVQKQIGRSRTSIEFKHQNISAVLKGLGEVWINGYKPAFNSQASLEDAVVRWLNANTDWGAPIVRSVTNPEMAEKPSLWIGPAPTIRNAPPPLEADQMAAIAVKFDVAERDERNRALGRAGEQRVLAHEQALLSKSGRDDLADQVRWVSELDGDGAGYDIASFQPDGARRLIEVKTTRGWERTPFHISRNELSVAEQKKSEWCLLRVWDFARNPRAFELRPPLQAHVSLMPTSFQANLH